MRSILPRASTVSFSLSSSWYFSEVEPRLGIRILTAILLFVNSVAITRRLPPRDKANKIIDRLLAKMKEVGYTCFLRDQRREPDFGVGQSVQDAGA